MYHVSILLNFSCFLFSASNSVKLYKKDTFLRKIIKFYYTNIIQHFALQFLTIVVLFRFVFKDKIHDLDEHGYKVVFN